MSRTALHITRSQVRGWFLVQSIIILSATLVGFLVDNEFIARSIFLGGLLSLFPQWIFSICWLNYYKANSAPHIVKMFYIGELIKLLLIGTLFILALKYITLHVLAFLIGFMIAQVAFWIAPLIWPNSVSISKSHLL